MFIFERSGSAVLTSLVLALALAGCGGEEETPPDTGLQPPPEGEGVQFRLQATISPSDEREFCKFVVAPPEELWMYADEVQFTSGSHHFLLYQTNYDEIPTVNEHGDPVDTSGVFDCSQGATDGWDVSRVIGGSQSGEGGRHERFPEGVALRLPANAVLLMNAHYLNSSPDTLSPEVRINLYHRDPALVHTEGDVLFLYNPFIHVPPRGMSRARYRCPVHSDITLVDVQSHMHRRGVGFEARLMGSETPFYENTDWEEVPVETFGGAGMEITAGSWLDYHCDYDNPEDRDVYQGFKTTDEMCMLVGSFYPADAATAFCSTEDGGLAGEWVGNGTATCAATLDCLLPAFGSDDLIRDVGLCMLDANPEVSFEASDLLRCFANSDNPMTDCESQITACQAM